MPFRAPDLVLPVESELVEVLLDAAEDPLGGPPGSAAPLLARIAAARDGLVREPRAIKSGAEGFEGGFRPTDIGAAVLGWSAGHRTIEQLRLAIAEARAALLELRQDDATLTLATAHGTKGLEFDHVAVIGLDAGRFPSARSIADAEEPARAMEEERRLAYVAWTRARRSLTLVYDPGAPSVFLLEAFSAAELGLVGQPPAT
jgi:superfamily I DNA/RNA helicase